MLSLYLAYLDDDNDKKLFEEMFYAYRKQMITLAVSILNNQSDAEDTVHNVFLRIAQKNWDTVRNIENKTDLRNYLLKSTKNTALNSIKDKKKENVSLDTVNEFNVDFEFSITDDDFFKAISDKVDYEKIVNAIKSLSDKYRDALYYHLVLEMSVKDTAKALQQTVSATQKQLFRGKKMLLHLLGIKGDENNGDEQE